MDDFGQKEKERECSAEFPAAGGIGFSVRPHQFRLSISLAGSGRGEAPLIAAKWDEEHKQYAKTNPGLADTGPNPGFLDAHARKDSDLQVKNPIKLITSGFEVPVKNRTPFKAGHKWRFVERVGWWDDYVDETPVIVGHYWRYFDKAHRFIPEEKGPDLFEQIPPLAWFGKRQTSIAWISASRQGQLNQGIART